jgi:hypothetical protein
VQKVPEIKRDAKMIHKRTLRRWLGIITLASLFLFNGVSAYAVTAPKGGKAVGRADIITIDTMKSFGGLQRPAVVFYHEKHYAAVEKKGKDCTVCHQENEENDGLSLKYMRQKDEASEAVMNIYHNNCIACHTDTAAAGDQSGPVECGECHKEKVDISSTWTPMGFDSSLHYRHSKAQEEKCEVCHHAYNKTTQKLFYDKGKEGTCRYCHKKETEENRIAGQFAAHIACIDCHLKTQAQDKTAGPVTCSGCHDPAEQELIAKVDPVPRMKRNQPNVVLLKSVGKAEKNPDLIRMNPVAFDHTAHEKYSNSCRACHHADLNACVSCHSVAGSKESENVKLEQAMHQLGTESSCMGCHTEAQADTRCAGCHSSIPKTRNQDSDACLTCHTTPPLGSAVISNFLNDSTIATALLSSRTPVTATYSQADIPEKVIIKALAKEYESVELPHRKIINTLLNNIKGNKLAGYFHREEGTICQGCHHNSPTAKKPPGCSSCHGIPFDENNMLRPGLKAAYHRQCMECHEVMGIEKPVATNCTGCHRKKA